MSQPKDAKTPYAKDLSYDLVEEVAKASSSSNQKDRQDLLELVRKARVTQGS